MRIKAASGPGTHVRFMKRGQVVTLDVRQDIQCGREPFVRIMRTVAQLAPAQKLLLTAPSEPLPLLRVMAARGFRYTANQTYSSRWDILFEPSKKAAAGCRKGAAAPSIEIDARGLEPPMPLVRILEAAETLPPETTVIARTDRCPLLLLEELPRRGFAGETEEISDGSYLTHIHRA